MRQAASSASAAVKMLSNKQSLMEFGPPVKSRVFNFDICYVWPHMRAFGMCVRVCVCHTRCVWGGGRRGTLDYFLGHARQAPSPENPHPISDQCGLSAPGCRFMDEHHRPHPPPQPVNFLFECPQTRLPLAQYACHLHLAKGELKSDHPGVFLLVFDNTHSR